MKRLINMGILLSALVGTASAFQIGQLNSATQKVLRNTGSYYIVNRTDYTAQENTDGLPSFQGSSMAERTIDFKSKYYLLEKNDTKIPFIKYLTINNKKLAVNRDKTKDQKEALIKELLHTYYPEKIAKPECYPGIAKAVALIGEGDKTKVRFGTTDIQFQLTFLDKVKENEEENKEFEEFDNVNPYEITIGEVKISNIKTQGINAKNIKTTFEDLNDDAVIEYTNAQQVKKTKTHDQIVTHNQYDMDKLDEVLLKQILDS